MEVLREVDGLLTIFVGNLVSILVLMEVLREAIRKPGVDFLKGCVSILVLMEVLREVGTGFCRKTGNRFQSLF